MANERGLWVPHPADILYMRDGGDGNMGDVTDEGNLKARFPVPPFDPMSPWDRAAIVSVRIRFTGGTGSATLDMKRDHIEGPDFDFTLDSWLARGTTGEDVFVRVQADELYHWTLEQGDAVVFEWTNPHASMRWAIELGIVDASRIPSQ